MVISIFEIGYGLGSSSMAIKSMSAGIQLLKFTMIMLMATSNSHFMHLSSIMSFKKIKVADLVN